MRYVEVFAGGASLYFRKEPSVQEVLNDKDDSVVLLLRGFRKYNGEVISKRINQYCSRQSFFKLKSYIPLDDFQIFIKTLLVRKFSFCGNDRSYNTNIIHNNPYNSSFTTEYNNRMRDTVITQLDYTDCIHKYDSESTLFYLDPPYENSNNKHYTHFSIDYHSLSLLLSKIEGKFILSINSSENIKEIFKQFDIVEIDNVFYPSNKTFHKELIITNY